MPLPIILIGIGAAASALGGSAMILNASDRIKNAKEHYDRRLRIQKEHGGSQFCA